MCPLLTGLFAVAPMIAFALEGGSVARDADASSRELGHVGEGVRATFRHWRTVLRGSVIGTAIGVLPGLGGTVASFIAYRSARGSAPDPGTFGKGDVVGVIAPESANNAKDGGALLPTLALGIPGSPETAVFLGILVLHGMDPGPDMLLHRHAEIYGLIAAVTASCVGASVLGILCARPLARVTLLDARLLAPIVIAVSLTGAYVLRGEALDMAVALLCGLVGYAMMREGFPRLTFVIAFVLGPEAERAYHQTQMISDGEALGFMLGRPQSLVLLALVAAVLAAPALVRSLRRR